MGLQARGGRDSQNLPRTPGSRREPAREHSSLIAVQIGSPGGLSLKTWRPPAASEFAWGYPPDLLGTSETLQKLEAQGFLPSPGSGEPG